MKTWSNINVSVAPEVPTGSRVAQERAGFFGFALRSTRRCLKASLGILVVMASATTSSYATNGFMWVSPCTSCLYLSDFVTAAENEAYIWVQPGTYVIVSQDHNETAYVKVSGTVKTHIIEGYPETVLVISAVTPIDANGNQVNSESYFVTLDATIFGTNRENPVEEVEVPEAYATSFVGSLDEEVGPGIDQALLAKGINVASLQVGTMIMVEFSDGTKAIYFIYQSPLISDHWQWAGVAWDKNGNPITRGGTINQNPNSSGQGGGDAGSTHQGTDTINFDLGGDPTCVTWQTITVNGVSSGPNKFYVPC